MTGGPSPTIPPGGGAAYPGQARPMAAAPGRSGSMNA